MNDLDLCLEVVQGHVNHFGVNISISKTTVLELQTSNLVHSLYGARAGAQIIFPNGGRGLGHVTPTIFGIRSNISSKLLES